MWFDILKRDGITHYHGTTKPGVAKLIMREGIKPMIDYKIYRLKNGDMIATKGAVPKEFGDAERVPELDGKYSWAAKDMPFGYSGWWDKHEAIDDEVEFDERGSFSGMVAGKPEEFSWEEGGIFGIKGADIEWLEVYSPCYRTGTIHYITKEIIPPSKIVWKPLPEWQKWYAKHSPEEWERCSIEIPEGRVSRSTYERIQSRRDWPGNR